MKIEKRGKYGKIKLWLAGITAVAFLLLAWEAAEEKNARHIPDYPQTDIRHYIEKESLTKEDYQVLFRQTGMSKVAVNALREQEQMNQLLDLQKKLFQEVSIQCEANTIISKEERIMSPISDEECASIPYLEDGDILISFNSHVLGWRNGHAAIVVDAKKRLTVEARVLGSDSAIMSMKHWEQYPSFAVLRLKNVTQKEREVIAEYAKLNMVGLTYRLTAGWGDWIYPENFTEGTHCAHLVWYAYREFGYDLDSDGGLIVTPYDLYESPLLEVVQVYGMPIPS